jgi:hypothetical protein
MSIKMRLSPKEPEESWESRKVKSLRGILRLSHRAGHPEALLGRGLFASAYLSYEGQSTSVTISAPVLRMGVLEYCWLSSA